MERCRAGEMAIVLRVCKIHNDFSISSFFRCTNAHETWIEIFLRSSIWLNFFFLLRFFFSVVAIIFQTIVDFYLLPNGILDKYMYIRIDAIVKDVYVPHRNSALQWLLCSQVICLRSCESIALYKKKKTRKWFLLSKEIRNDLLDDGQAIAFEKAFHCCSINFHFNFSMNEVWHNERITECITSFNALFSLLFFF